MEFDMSKIVNDAVEKALKKVSDKIQGDYDDFPIDVPGKKLGERFASGFGEGFDSEFKKLRSRIESNYITLLKEVTINGNKRVFSSGFSSRGEYQDVLKSKVFSLPSPMTDEFKQLYKVNSKQEEKLTEQYVDFIKFLTESDNKSGSELDKINKAIEKYLSDLEKRKNKKMDPNQWEMILQKSREITAIDAAYERDVIDMLFSRTGNDGLYDQVDFNRFFGKIYDAYKINNTKNKVVFNGKGLEAIKDIDSENMIRTNYSLDEGYRKLGRYINTPLNEGENERVNNLLEKMKDFSLSTDKKIEDLVKLGEEIDSLHQELLSKYSARRLKATVDRDNPEEVKKVQKFITQDTKTKIGSMLSDYTQDEVEKFNRSSKDKIDLIGLEEIVRQRQEYLVEFLKNFKDLEDPKDILENYNYEKLLNPKFKSGVELDSSIDFMKALAVQKDYYAKNQNKDGADKKGKDVKVVSEGEVKNVVEETSAFTGLEKSINGVVAAIEKKNSALREEFDLVSKNIPEESKRFKELAKHVENVAKAVELEKKAEETIAKETGKPKKEAGSYDYRSLLNTDYVTRGLLTEDQINAFKSKDFESDQNQINKDIIKVLSGVNADIPKYTKLIKDFAQIGINISESDFVTRLEELKRLTTSEDIENLDPEELFSNSIEIEQFYFGLLSEFKTIVPQFKKIKVLKTTLAKYLNQADRDYLSSLSLDTFDSKKIDEIYNKAFAELKPSKGTSQNAAEALSNTSYRGLLNPDYITRGIFTESQIEEFAKTKFDSSRNIANKDILKVVNEFSNSLAGYEKLIKAFSELGINIEKSGFESEINGLKTLTSNGKIQDIDLDSLLEGFLRVELIYGDLNKSLAEIEPHKKKIQDLKSDLYNYLSAGDKYYIDKYMSYDNFNAKRISDAYDLAIANKNIPKEKQINYRSLLDTDYITKGIFTESQIDSIKGKSFTSDKAIDINDVLKVIGGFKSDLNRYEKLITAFNELGVSISKSGFIDLIAEFKRTTSSGEIENLDFKNLQSGSIELEKTYLKLSEEYARVSGESTHIKELKETLLDYLNDEAKDYVNSLSLDNFDTQKITSYYEEALSKLKANTISLNSARKIPLNLISDLENSLKGLSPKFEPENFEQNRDKLASELYTSKQQIASEDDVSKIKDYRTEIEKLRVSVNQFVKETNSKDLSSSGILNKLQEFAKDNNLAIKPSILLSYRQLEDSIKNGAISATEAEKRFEGLRATFQKSASIMSSITKVTKQLSYQFFSFYRIISYIRKMYTAVKDVDTAMTELRKVSEETESAYVKFLDEAIAKSQRLGASVSDVISATSEFARLGYNLAESSNLAESAILYKNVGDGINSVSEAASSIISTMKAFGEETYSSMKIVDEFNYVGNNFAITSGGIGEALTRSASAMAQAGNTLEESIALITTANTIVQDTSTVGTALKTMSLRIGKTKAELQELEEDTGYALETASAYRDMVLAATRPTSKPVDIMKDDLSTYKSTYEILKDLSEVWDEIDQSTQNALLYTLGGLRQANTLSAILNNFSIAEDVVTSLDESTGSALRENEKYLESIAGKLNQLKASFEAFSTDLLNSDLIKFFIDFANGVVSTTDKIVELTGSIGFLATALVGLSAAKGKNLFRVPFVGGTGFFGKSGNPAPSLLKNLSMYSNAEVKYGHLQNIINPESGKSLLNTTGSVDDFAASVDDALTGVEGIDDAFKDFTVSSIKGAESISEAQSILSGIAKNTKTVAVLKSIGNQFLNIGIQMAAMALFSVLAKVAVSALKSIAKTNEQVQKSIEDHKEKLSETASEYDELRKKQESRAKLTSAEKARLDYLKTYSDYLEETIKKEEKENWLRQNQHKAIYDKEDTLLDRTEQALGINGIASTLTNAEEGILKFESLSKAIEESENKIEEYQEALENVDLSEMVTSSPAGPLSMFPLKISKSEQIESSISQARKELEEAKEGLQELDFDESYLAIADQISELEVLKAEWAAGQEAFGVTETSKKSIDDVNNKLDKARKIQKELNDSGKVSQSVIDEVDDRVKNFSEDIKTWNNVKLINPNDFKDILDSKTFNDAKQAITNYYEAIASGKELTLANEILKKDLENLTDEQVEAVNKAIAKYNNMISRVDNVGFEAINEKIDETQSALQTLNTAVEEYRNHNAYSLDTLQALTQLDSRYLNLLIDEEGKLNLNTEAVNKLRDARINELRIQAIYWGVNQLQQLADEASATEFLASQYVGLANAEYTAAQAAFAVASAQALTRGGEDMAAAVQMITNRTNAMLGGIGTFDAYGSSGKSAVEKVNDALKAQGQAMIDSLNDQKEALQDQLDALEDKYDQEDKEFELQKKIVAWQQAQANKTVRVYTHDNGWVWQADQTAVKSAKDELEEYQRELKREDAKQAIQDQIDGIDELIDSINDSMDLIGTTLEDYERDMALAAQYTAMNFDEMKRRAADYADAVKAALQPASAYESGSGGGIAGSYTKEESSVSIGEDAKNLIKSLQELGLQDYLDMLEKIQKEHVLTADAYTMALYNMYEAFTTNKDAIESLQTSASTLGIDLENLNNMVSTGLISYDQYRDAVENIMIAQSQGSDAAVVTEKVVEDLFAGIEASARAFKDSLAQNQEEQVENSNTYVEEERAVTEALNTEYDTRIQKNKQWAEAVVAGFKAAAAARDRYLKEGNEAEIENAANKAFQSALDYMPAQMYHSGGLVEGVAAGANVSSAFAKYMGSLKADEVPAILQSGEWVLTKAQQKAIVDNNNSLLSKVKSGIGNAISIGDIVINNPVGSVSDLSKAIISKLPQQIMRDVYV